MPLRQLRLPGSHRRGCRTGQRLRESGLEAAGSLDIVRLVGEGNSEAVRMVREAGRAVGEVLSGLVNFFNPETVVVGGALAAVHDQLLAGVREAVYRRSNPLATHVLRIEPSGSVRTRPRSALPSWRSSTPCLPPRWTAPSTDATAV